MALEADSGDRLTALEALGEDIALPEEEAAERVPVRVPKKLPAAPSLKPKAREETVRAPVPEPAELGPAQDADRRFEAWRISKEQHDKEAAAAGRHPALHGGHDRLASELRELTQEDGLSAETRAAVEAAVAGMDAERAGACLAGLRSGLEARARLDRPGGPTGPVDSPGYAAWRLELEAAATVARDILGTDGPHALPDGADRDELAARLAETDALLAEDDALFGAPTAAGRVHDWHSRWTHAMKRADEPDGAEELDRLAPLGRRVASDPGLGALDRGHVTTALDDWEARREAEDAGAAWLAAWNGDAEDESAGRSAEAVTYIEKGQRLSEDPAMPVALRQSHLDALREHDGAVAEHAEREARRKQAREAATAARKEADDIAFRLRTGNWTQEVEEMDRLLARGERLAADRDFSGAERRRLEEALGRERERRAAGLLGGVRALDPGEALPHALLSRAGAVARDPKLDDGTRANLDTAVDNARKRADAQDRFQEWRRDWNAFVKPIEDAGRPVFADKACKSYVERARALARDPHIGAAAKETLETTIRRNDVEYPEHVRSYEALMKQWKAARADAKTRKLNRFDMEGAAGIVEEMRTLAGSPHLTGKQKKAFRDIAAEYAARQQQREEARQLSQRLGGGRSM